MVELVVLIARLIRALKMLAYEVGRSAHCWRMCGDTGSGMTAVVAIFSSMWWR